MVTRLTILALGLLVVNVAAGPLDRAASYPDDDGDFLHQFLNKVDKKDPPHAHDPDPLPLPSYSGGSKNSDGKAGSSGHRDGDDGYEHDDEDDDDYYGDDYDLHEEDPYYATALFCRMVVYPHALNPGQCAEVKIKDYDPDFIYDHTHKTDTKGKCYWDRHLGKIDQQSGCLCPRPKKNCNEKKQCYWHVLPNPGKHEDDKGYGHDDHDDKEDDYGHCIHNSERFYNLLANLLKKRGKKDLSLQIEYSSIPAKGKLPYGPYGPAVIGNDGPEYPAYPQYPAYPEYYGAYPYQPAYPSEPVVHPPDYTEPQEHQLYGIPDPYPSTPYQMYDHQAYPSYPEYPVEPTYPEPVYPVEPLYPVVPSFYPSPCQQPYYMPTPAMDSHMMPYPMGPVPYQPYCGDELFGSAGTCPQHGNYGQSAPHAQPYQPLYNQPAADKIYDSSKSFQHVQQSPSYQPTPQIDYGHTEPQTYQPPVKSYSGYQSGSGGYAEVNRPAQGQHQGYSQQNNSPDPNPYQGRGVGSGPDIYVV